MKIFNKIYLQFLHFFINKKYIATKRKMTLTIIEPQNSIEFFFEVKETPEPAIARGIAIHAGQKFLFYLYVFIKFIKIFHLFKKVIFF